ncbi:terpene cyclase/mutase family protein [Mariniblastus sp.]|nr:prenyltransferase/squalene oxidase repeat-containing protein [Mariniblastus sp.]MDB4755739.1 terpene cyclase/mutase family protein [Mariniblastus sp.]
MLPVISYPTGLLLADFSGLSFLEIALWSGLTLFVILATVLTWTGWGQVKPLWKCVALSVFAHILLGGYAYGTRLFYSYSNSSQEQPISFSISEKEIEPDLLPDNQENTAIEPWNRIVKEDGNVPQEVFQEKLNANISSLPERTPVPSPLQNEIPFPNPKLPDLKPVEVASKKSPMPSIEQFSNINQSKFEPVRPDEIEIPKKTIKRNTSFPSPSSTENLVEKIKPDSSTAINSIRKTLASNSIEPDVDVDQLVQNVIRQPTHLSEASPDLQDVNSITNVKKANEQPWNSASFSEKDPSKTTASQKSSQPRRLGDGLPIPKIYQNRFSTDRNQIVKQQGGSLETEEAVRNALRWLGREQEDDGSWNPRRYNAGQETNVYGHNRGGAGYYADSGITGLVILAFLGAGHTHLEGEYQQTVQKGLEYLIRTQHEDGNLSGNAGLFARNYCHAMAMLAITEAYSITGDYRIKPFMEKAQQFIVSGQNKTTGGWRYRPGDDGDMSQFGWQVLALKSAAQAGVAIPGKTEILMKRFVRSYIKGSYGGLSAYRPAEKPSRTMTAESILCQRLLNLEVSPDASREAFQFVLEERPDESKIENLYYWYYATLALHHEKNIFEFQEANWRSWNESLTQKLLGMQVKTGKATGSYPANSLWSSYGGRFYSTAMSTLSLEVYYRYQPQKLRAPSTASNNVFRR